MSTVLVPIGMLTSASFVAMKVECRVANDSDGLCKMYNLLFEFILSSRLDCSCQLSLDSSKGKVGKGLSSQRKHDRGAAIVADSA